MKKTVIFIIIKVLKQKIKTMSLSDIRKKLYQKNQDRDLPGHDPSSFDIRAGGVNFSDKFKDKEEWGKKKPVADEERRRAIKWGALAVAGILGVVLLVIGVLNFARASFSEKRVTVSIQGPKEGESGKLLSYVIEYKNDNRIPLKNATLRLNFPESFKPEISSNFKPDGNMGGTINIGEIKRRETSQIIFSGRVYNPRGTLIYIKAGLSYFPSNFNSKFDSLAQADIHVTSTPIELEVMAPQTISTGDAVDYLVSYKNTGQKDFENISIKADYPDGFTFGKSDPSVSESNNIWYIGHLSPGQEGKIVVSGKLEGNQGDIKNVQVFTGSMNQGEFFTYNEEKSRTQIVASPLTVKQSVNGLTDLSVKAGDVLRFEINYKNTGNLGFRDVIVTEKLDNPALDYATLRSEGGAFDSGNRTITWKASDYPRLKFLGPGQDGIIRFSIKIKDVIPVVNANDKNFVISSLVKIDSLDIPTPINYNKIIAGNKLDMQLNTKLLLSVKGFYNDPTIGNSGPVPPQVGKETTYTIHWQVANVSNDIIGAKVEAVLPAGVSMTDKIFPEDAHLTHNSRNNTIIWDIGNVSAGTGILSAPKEVVFQIKFIPSPNQGGAPSANILGPSIFSGRDTFTGNNLTMTAERKTTILKEDAKLDSSAYYILPAS